jgi:hypothetical protein
VQHRGHRFQRYSDSLKSGCLKDFLDLLAKIKFKNEAHLQAVAALEDLGRGKEEEQGRKIELLEEYANGLKKLMGLEGIAQIEEENLRAGEQVATLNAFYKACLNQLQSMQKGLLVLSGDAISQQFTDNL